jgi:hypothetical protein
MHSAQPAILRIRETCRRESRRVLVAGAATLFIHAQDRPEIDHAGAVFFTPATQPIWSFSGVPEGGGNDFYEL